MYRRKWLSDVIGSRGVLGVALDVRMTANGSIDRSQEDQDADIAALKEVADGWKPSLVRYQRFDDAVLELILSAIAEAEMGGVTRNESA